MPSAVAYPPSLVLTGATGFIGAAVRQELLRRNVRPLVLLRPESDPSRQTALDPRLTFTSAAWAAPDLIAQLAPHRPEALIHCAWRGVGGADRNAAFQVEENLPLTLATVRLAAATGCRHWVGLGSQAEYGNPNRIVTEESAPRPTTAYGEAKLAAGREALALCARLGITGSWLRVFSTYGPGDHPRWLIPHVIREFLHGRAPQVTRCEQRWDYLYVDDAARAIVEVACSRSGGVHNLGSGEAPVLRDTVEQIRRECGATVAAAYGAVPYRDDQVFHLQADISKLTFATGWTPRVPLTDGIRATVAHERSLLLPPTS
jgi:nucleoside-diphosphate-sugar epimerase